MSGAFVSAEAHQAPIGMRIRLPLNGLASWTDTPVEHTLKRDGDVVADRIVIAKACARVGDPRFHSSERLAARPVRYG